MLAPRLLNEVGRNAGGRGAIKYYALTMRDASGKRRGQNLAVKTMTSLMQRCSAAQSQDVAAATTKNPESRLDDALQRRTRPSGWLWCAVVGDVRATSLTVCRVLGQLP